MPTLPTARSLAGLFLFLSAVALSACGGGGSGSDPVGTDTTPGNCSGSCVTPTSNLTIADVQQVISQAVAEAKALGVTATIGVVDRVGNVLAVYRMASQEVLIASAVDAGGNSQVISGLDGIRLPTLALPAPIDHLAAISKAITGAYLSSEGNAFTSRTASQIVQRNFNPGEDNQPGGPLFGVQFSQLACSDFTLRFSAGADAGPKRSPLGLAADPGGLPLYKDGTPVGGVGVISDGLYSVDPSVSDSDLDNDELIATAATFSYSAPLERRADRITVDGKTFRFADVDFSDLAVDPQNAPGFGTLTGADGMVISVTGYTDGTIIGGTAFGTAQSGIRPDSGVNFPGQDAFIFVDAADVPRFPPIDAPDGGLTAGEVQTILAEALSVANRARAQIRRPLGDTARVTISVVDTDGAVLGIVRTRDAPIFGADVSLQKARTAAFFSAADAGAFLQSLPPATYAATTAASINLGDYVDEVRNFFDDPQALTGSIAFSDRAGGNLSRPNFPDGLSNAPPGPLSKPPGQWSVFSTGLQLDLTNNAILQHVLASSGLVADVGNNCIGVDLGNPGVNPFSSRLANGIQIFPGSVPIYRGNQLLGGIGVSGDGIDQDDMISFLGLHNAGSALGSVNNAPAAIRADTLEPQGVRLRYIQCPQSPFVDSDEDNVCEGK